MSGVAVRAATPGDAALVLHLIQESFAAYRGWLQPPSSSADESVASIGAILARGGAALAFIDGEAAGTVLWQPKADSVYLGRLSVLPSCRRRGIAGVLIDWVEAEARRQGVAAVTLGVRIALPDNHRLFASRGFVEIGRTAHHGWHEPTSIDMRKELI